MLDLSEYPLIDNHVHPFIPEARNIRSERLAELISLGAHPDFLVSQQVLQKYEKLTGSEREAFDVKHSISKAIHQVRYHGENWAFFKLLTVELARYLSCSPTLQDIIKARNQRAVNYGSYINDLFTAAKIEGVVMDNAYPQPPVTVQEFQNQVPAKVHRMFRIETFIKRLLETTRNFADFMKKFDEGIEAAVRKERCVAFKSVIAYRTGLDLTIPAETEARKDFERQKEKKEKVEWFGPRVKKLRDYLVYLTTMKSIKLNVPFQIHTGFGDYDIVLEKCSPKNLFSFLKDEDVRKATIVLTHGGYPFAIEAAYICNVLPNVYYDLSLIMPFSSFRTPARVAQALEMAPITKIMYGSDAFNIPELYWLGGVVGRRALATALQEMIDFGIFNEDEAENAGKKILADNARSVYKI